MYCSWQLGADLVGHAPGPNGEAMFLFDLALWKPRIKEMVDVPAGNT